MSALLGSQKSYSTLHDSILATVAEVAALTCARAITGGREFFLGESATSHPFAAHVNSCSKLDSMISEEVNEYQMLLQYNGHKLYAIKDADLTSRTHRHQW